MPETTWLQPLTLAHQANRQLTVWMTPWWKRLNSGLPAWLQKRKADGQPASRARCELVFLPCAVVQFSGRKDKTKPAPPTLLVNGYAGNTVALNLNAFHETPRNPGTLLFHYPLSIEQTLESARQYLLNLQLRRVLKLPEQETKTLRWERVVQYPFWVRYAEQFPGTVRFEMLDGIVHQRGGTLVRQGFLRALDVRERKKAAAPEPCLP